MILKLKLLNPPNITRKISNQLKILKTAPLNNKKNFWFLPTTRALKSISMNCLSLTILTNPPLFHATSTWITKAILFPLISSYSRTPIAKKPLTSRDHTWANPSWDSLPTILRNSRRQPIPHSSFKTALPVLRMILTLKRRSRFLNTSLPTWKTFPQVKSPAKSCLH